MKKKTQEAINEDELLETIEIISKKLAYKFKFGYHEIEDMKQQISVFAIEGLRNYDHKRPLENFLWTHVRNRLFNFKRDNYQRPDKPCRTCPFYNKNCGNPDTDCEKFANKLDCSLYKSWYTRNSSKKNLMYLNTIEELKECLSNRKIDYHKLEDQESIDILDRELIGEHREIYLKIKMGIKVGKADIGKLNSKVKDIFNE